MLARAAVLRGSAPLHDPDCLSSWQIKNEHSRPPMAFEAPAAKCHALNSSLLSQLSQKWLFTITWLETVSTEDQSPPVSASFSHRLSLPGPGGVARGGPAQRAPVLTAPSGCGRDPAALKELEEVVTMETLAAALIGRDAQTPPPPSGAAGGVPRGRDFPGTSGKRAVLGYGSGSGVARGILGVAVRHRVRRTLRALRLGSAGGAGRGGAGRGGAGRAVLAFLLGIESSHGLCSMQ